MFLKIFKKKENSKKKKRKAGNLHIIGFVIWHFLVIIQIHIQKDTPMEVFRTVKCNEWDQIFIFSFDKLTFIFVITKSYNISSKKSILIIKFSFTL